MTRAHLARLFGLALLPALLLVSPPAEAWESPEHEKIRRAAMIRACRESGAPWCLDYVPFAAAASAEPDYCHSFWFSRAGIMVNRERQAERENCQIRDGIGYSGFDNSLFPYYLYMLPTNANHFGRNIQPHYRHYQALALEAARRYRDIRESYLETARTTGESEEDALLNVEPLLSQCRKAAVGLAGFASHYLTDHTATGHAFTAEPRYGQMEAFSDLRMAGLRAR